MTNETLKKWALAQLKKKTTEGIKNLKNQFKTNTREHWKDETELLNAWFIKETFKKKELEQLKNYKYEKIIREYVKKRIIEIKNSSEKTAKEIEAICISNMPQFIDIVVEWKKNRTWGANPRAEVRTGDFYFISSSIGGCGYDKESTATAQCFNKDLGLKKCALVAMYNNAHKPKNKRYINGVHFFNCSTSFFEGGCGFSCHRHVFELAGFKLEHQSSGKMFDSYYFVRKGAKNV